MKTPALFSGIGFVLTLLFLCSPHTPWLMVLFTFVAQPCFLLGGIFWALQVKKGCCKHEEAT